ncbi:Pectinesterase 1 [Cardamine amara subsp. amara]|uniref:Pectinesterase n=1 Tax=Cardamine amara subsp. amara TaxID=228776 RepID=A0ABD1AKR2_CARAN
MDTVKSFKGYGKVDEAQDLALKRKTRKRLFLVGISVVVLVGLFIGSVVAVVAHTGSPNSKPGSVPELTPASSLKSVCSVTRYPDSCVSSISKLSSSNTTDPKVLFRLSLKVVIDELSSIFDFPKKLTEETDDVGIKSALRVCGEMFDDAMDDLNEAISVTDVGDEKKILNLGTIDDIKTWLSAVLADHGTCFDALDELSQFDIAYANSTISRNLKSAMKNSTEYTSISLSIVARVLSPLSDLGIPIHGRRLLNSKFPNWVRPGVRRLLQRKHFRPDITVAKDGSGDVKTINEAVGRIPDKSKTRFVIYVKSGTYMENVLIDKNKWNVTIYGDGKDKTIISGSKYTTKTLSTFDTATLGVTGYGFILKDIGVKNTAGPENHQAVALRSSSDHSVYYQCSFDGYQDTLYSHRKRQFYRNCDITGTVDFIFGMSTVVFQECNIRPRQPLPNQFNAITAQGNDHWDVSTGIVIHRCTISALGNVSVPTYLGRPWKNHSRTVVMESVIGPVVSAEGWKAWDAKSDPPQPTLRYGEYKNSGPGSDVTHRVKWVGYTPVMTDAEARKLSVATFLDENRWMTKMQVPYNPTL